MPEFLSATVTNTSNVISISVSDSHIAPTSMAVITAEGTTLDIGDAITIVLGYTGDTFTALTGFVKNIEHKEPERFYTITAANVMSRAVDFFIASSDPDDPFSRQNITAEDLIQDLLELSGLTSFDMDATSFTFAINNPVEVNLVGCFDYCKFLADIIAHILYADNAGVVHLVNRRPYPVGGDTSVITFDKDNVLDGVYHKSDYNIRNKVIVYGSGEIHAEESEGSPYLPAGFFRTVVVAAPGVIDSQSMAEQSAEYNLELLNRLTQKVTLTTLGITGLEPRTVCTVDLPGIGLNNEEYYIYSVEHNWSKAGYITSLELRK